MSVRIACRVEPCQIQIADVVAERIVHSLHTAEHHRAPGVIVAVIILVQRSIAPVRVPCLSILIGAGVVDLIILENGILALPRPDSCCHDAESRILVIRRINVARRSIGHVILYQGPIAVHRCDSVPSHIFYVVIPDHHIAGTVFYGSLVTDLRTLELIPVRGICSRNAPAVCPLHMAVGDLQVIVPGNTCRRFIFRQRHDEIDASVEHVLVVHIAINIMNVQIIQHDMIRGPDVLCDSCHAGTVHDIQVIPFQPGIRGIDPRLSVISDLQPSDLNILHILEQDSGRYIASVFMLCVIQRLSKILIPYPFSIGIDLGAFSFSICGDDDWSLLAPTALNVQELVVEYRALFQKHLISRLERDLIDLVQRLKRRVLLCAGVGVISF